MICTKLNPFYITNTHNTEHDLIASLLTNCNYCRYNILLYLYKLYLYYKYIRFV